MIIIGIIGDIGSGKSYIAKLFNCPTFNADFEVSKIYKRDRSCFQKLKKKLPKYITRFPVNKTELSKAVINSNTNLKKIVKIVHPIIRNKMHSFLRKNKNKKLVVLDIPLLIENKINKNSYILIFVDAKKKEIIKRLKKRSNYNGKIFSKFKKLQLPVEIKRKKSDFVIKNNFKHHVAKKNVKKVLKQILLNDRSYT